MPCRRASLGAFTLIEIMMVVAIIGLVMTMGVPAILRAKQQEPGRLRLPVLKPPARRTIQFNRMFRQATAIPPLPAHHR